MLPVWHLSQNIKKFSAVTRPLPPNSLHGGEEELELANSDAVAGQHPQQLHQQVSNYLQIKNVGEAIKNPQLLYFLGNSPKRECKIFN